MGVDSGFGEDEYEEEEEMEEEDEEEREERKRKRRKGSQFIDDAAEEDDDEDEEEEDVPRKKKGAGSGYKRSVFVDDVAAVASDEEEEEIEEEDGFIDKDVDIPEESEGRRASHHRTLLPRDDELDEQEYERFLEERYARTEVGDFDELEATDVEQQALLPSVMDPKLWMVKCQLGHEREAAVSLMQKYVNLEAEGKPPLIKSAISLDNLKGMIYVESFKDAYVKEACRGLRLLYSWKVTLVPIKEMAGVLTVEQKSVELDIGSWVRVKIGVYKGDLAQVTDMDSVKMQATVKLIPRIDLQAIAQKQEGTEVTKRSTRPAPRFFSVDEAKTYGVRVQETRHRGTGEMVHMVEGMQFSGGYLLKVVSMKTLDTKGVVPTLDELQKFQAHLEDAAGNGSSMGMSLAPALANKQRTRLMKGDVVEVIEGDLKGLMGKVEKVEEDEVIIRAHHEDLKDLLPVKESQLRKFFQTGDHVKVVAGQHEGDTGLIIKVSGQVVVIYSDTSREHVKVFARDIMSSSEVTSGMAQIGEYELHDLVLLDQMTFGVIVKIEKAGCHVLKATPERSDVVAVKVREIRRKIMDSKASVQDADNSVISVKDPVRIIMGLYKGKQGSAEHIHRGIIFVFDRSHPENGGFICVRSRSCSALSSSSPSSNSPATRQGRGSPALGWRESASFDQRASSLRSPSHLLQSPRNFPGSPARQRHGGGQNAPGSFGGGRTGHRRDDGLVGRMVKIRSGPYKGYRGRVLDATDTTARIELESQMKIVTVRKDQLPDGAAAAQPTPFREASSRQRGGAGMGSETPVHPSRTPMHPGFGGGRSDPSATPIHDGMRTPMRSQAWNPHVPTTPLRSDSWDDANPSTWGQGGGSNVYTAYNPAFSPPDSAPSPADSHNPPTPSLQQFDADTPDSLPGNYHASTPYSDTASPYQVPTPQSMTPSTPGGGTPGTPGGFPLTPGQSPMDPTSPAMGGPMNDGGEDRGGLPGVLVLVSSSASEKEMAVIREVLPDGSCRVSATASSNDLFVVSPSDMELVPPKKNDKVKILKGEMRGAVGKLIGVDGVEGIVKIDDEVKILEVSSLGKLS